MSEVSPRIRLNNGVEMPAFGLGVFQSKPEETATAVETALKNGYRLIDTAAAYFNEDQVGEGIARAEVDRAELFVTTKLWISDYGYESTLNAFEESRKKLGLDYIDLYLLHWPLPREFSRTLESYKAAERLLADGRVRAIGVCNFKPNHMGDLMAQTSVVPAVNQIELSPYFSQKESRADNAARGIVTQAWAPIRAVTPIDPTKPDDKKKVLEEPVIVSLAEKYGKDAARIVLRWDLQHGLSTIPKSVTPERIVSNIDVFDFELTADEMNSIDALDTGRRSFSDPDVFDESTVAIRKPKAPSRTA